MYKIYYEDGSIHDGSQTRYLEKTADEAETYEESIAEPSRGNLMNPPPLKDVVAIVQVDKDNEAEMLSGKEYYLWKDQHWVGTDLWHVMAHLEEHFDLIKYKKNKLQVKTRGKWKSADMATLFAHMEDSGLVLHGTMETPKRTLEIMTKVIEDLEAGDLPESINASRGMRLSMQVRDK